MPESPLSGPVVIPHLMGAIDDMRLSWTPPSVVWWDFGDSMSRQIDILMDTLRGSLRNGGCALGSCFVALSGGAALVPDAEPIWVNGNHYEVPADGTAVLGFDYLGGVMASMRSTTLKVFYVGENSGAGVNMFKFQYSDDEGANWHDIGSTIDTHNAGGIIGAVATTTRSIGNYRVRALGVVGTCKIIGAALLNDIEGGIVHAKTSLGGISLATMLAAPEVVTAPIIAALAPKVFSYLERPEPGWGVEMLESLRERSLAAYSHADWVWQQMTPVETDNAVVISTNAVIRDFALENDDFVFDAYSSFGSFARLQSAGMDDGVHLTPSGYRYVVSRWLATTGLLLGATAPINFMRMVTSSTGHEIVISAPGENQTNTFTIEKGKDAEASLMFYGIDKLNCGGLMVRSPQGFGGGSTLWSPNALSLFVPGFFVNLYNFHGFHAVYIGTNPDDSPDEQLTVQNGIKAKQLKVSE